MARNLGPQCRLCRAEHKKLFLKGTRCYSAKCPIAKKAPAPGKGPKDRTKKLSDYGLQLREKQRLKRMYGLLEKQFKNLFVTAEKLPGRSGDNLIILLERRLDNIVYRMRFASSRKQARQIVSHGHVFVNGKRVNIPSFKVKMSDVISISPQGQKIISIKESLKEFTKSGVVPWLEVDPDTMTGKVNAIPRRSDITDLADIKDQLVVALYSR